MKTRVAEWMLEIVLPPDRVAAIVGDWMEDARKRGSFWFWSYVFRTLVAHVWSDLTGNPLTMVRLGLSGFVRNVLVVLGIQGAIFLLILWPYHGDTRYRHDWIWNTLMVNHATYPAPPQHSLRWQIEMIWLLLYGGRLVQTARWITRRVPGREFAACLSTVLMGWIAIGLAMWIPRNATVDPGGFVLFIANDIILCSAVVWMRRNTYRQHKDGMMGFDDSRRFDFANPD